MSVSPPRPKGPPLNALRAFEAAVRLGGFAAAAEELYVTPGAVAQHVKALEAWIGADLFERRSQGVVPTPLGAGVADDFRDAFDRLGEATQILRLSAAPNVVRVAALPSIAQLWLSPRLPAIREAVPDVTISVTAMETPPNLRREPFDISIFYASGDPRSETIVLAHDAIYPVCAPALAGRLKEPGDLAAMPLLHDSRWSRDWEIWAGNNGLEIDTQSEGGSVFSLYSLAVEEARNGAGVLIGHEALVRRHLDEGTLVAPFEGALSLARYLTLSVAGKPAPGTPLGVIVEALSARDGGAAG